MNIEDIKAELAKLEPEADALWKQLQELEEKARPIRNAWHVKYERVMKIKAVLELIEPKKEETYAEVECKATAIN